MAAAAITLFAFDNLRAVPEPDGTVKIYWGGADTVMCMGEANLDELAAPCLEKSRRAV